MQYYSFFKIFIVRSAEFLELYNVPDPIFKVDPTKVKPQVPLFFYCIFTDNRYSGGGRILKVALEPQPLCIAFSGTILRNDLIIIPKAGVRGSKGDPLNRIYLRG